MRIGILHDSTFAERPGGAARLASRLLAAAPSNHEVVPCAPGAVDRTCDAYALLLTKRFSDDELAFVAQQPFVRYELDYWQNFEGAAHWRDRLNERARQIFFCSPLHARVYQYRHRVDFHAKVVHLPCALDPAEYRPVRERWPQEKRPFDAIWYGEWQWLKAPDLAMNWAYHQKRHLDMHSTSMPEGVQPSNEYVHLGGFIEEQHWLDTIATHRTFVHFPRQPECFPYSILEAYLLGCEVITSGRLGVESYGHGLDDLIGLAAHGAETFWSFTMAALS